MLTMTRIPPARLYLPPNRILNPLSDGCDVDFDFSHIAQQILHTVISLKISKIP